MKRSRTAVSRWIVPIGDEVVGEEEDGEEGDDDEG
jgi:hypothetical protein